jgi:hypothetical protein
LEGRDAGIAAGDLEGDHAHGKCFRSWTLEQTTAFNWHRETGDYAATVAALLNAAP